MWNILITLFSIGYGDIFTYTLLGRVIIILLSFYGGFVISVITIAILGELEMSKFENNSFVMMDFLVKKVFGLRS
jgi:potassium intermediate/small conductance calcium-activated channel subfamily N protein 2